MARGVLRIYLGAAPGVGKTFAMLNEGWRRKQRGSADVVVGVVETHGRKSTGEQLRDLEVVPRRNVEYRGAQLSEMDVDAILAREPDVCLVDELAHTNVPGSRNEKRWQDVEELIAAGIEVISTVNIQHLESLNDVVEQITGVVQQETIPDAIVRAADQVELVDMSPETLRRRLAHGNVYAAERVDAALANYFRVGNLAALRELALLWVADRVDEALQQYREDHGIAGPWETRERVVVALTGSPGGAALVRRAARMAMRAKGDLLGVHVRSSDGLTSQSGGVLEEHRALLAEFGGTYHELAADDVGAALVQFARAENATQIVIGASRRSRFAELTHASVINRVLRRSGSIDVHVISSEAEGGDSGPRPSLHLSRRVPAISPRRRAAAWILALAGPPLLALLLSGLRSDLRLTSVLLLFLLLTVIAAALGGYVPATVSAASSFLLANWFFTPPIHQFTIAEGDNILALVIFLVVSGVVSAFVGLASRRASDAARARAEAETLGFLGGSLIGGDDSLHRLLGHLRTTFDVASVAVMRNRGGGAWSLEEAVGEPVPDRPEAGDLSLPIGGDATLVLTGARLSAEDLDVLRAFSGQLGLVVERRELRAHAERYEGIEAANELRTALLAAVSHDLRTPLSSIKAAVTSLLQDDVDWSPEATTELLQTIDEESDRLNLLVGNLLDMSRLQSGSMQLLEREIGLDEVVPRAVAGLLVKPGRLVIDVGEHLPRVVADPALLERAVANVIGNALNHSPDGSPVRVEAGVVKDRVHLRVIDRGPGIPVAQREQVFAPFQRLGDRPNGGGVGLGLAVARGFVELMHGEIVIDDTPGGGTTMVISLPMAGGAA